MASSVSEEKLAESIKDLRIDNVNVQKESINSDDETWNELKLVGVPLEVKEDTPVVEVKEYSNHEKHRKEINDVHSLSNQKSSTQESDDERESEDEDESSEPNRLRKRSEDDDAESIQEEDDFVSVSSDEEGISGDESSNENLQWKQAEGVISEQVSEDVTEGESNGKAPTFVPRRTGFWDHDDRFADINVEASRKPKFNPKKLWDKSEVDRWQHDKYVESEQRPKEKWEIEQHAHDEARNKTKNEPREKRQLGDFLNNNNQNRKINGYKNVVDDEKNTKKYHKAQNYRRSNEDEKEWVSSNEHENPRFYSNKRGPKNHDSEFGVKINPIKTRNPDPTKSKNEIKNTAEQKNVSQDKTPVYKDKTPVYKDKTPVYKDKTPVYKGKKDLDGNESKSIVGGVAQDSYSFQRQGEKGRGRSISEFSDSRHKRIDELPPRLQEKAREKADQDREKKFKQTQSEEDEVEVNEEILQEDIAGPDDGVPRDKPKRYSSQRQKTGTSLMDIPAEINEMVDPATQYQHLVYMQQAMYASQLAAMQQQSHNQEQRILQMQAQLQHQHLQQIQQRSSTNIGPPPLNMAMPLSNMISPMIPGANHSGLYTGDLYTMNPALLTGNEDIMENPQINQMLYSQFMGMQQQHAATGGLFIPPTSSPQISDMESHRTRYK